MYRKTINRRKTDLRKVGTIASFLLLFPTTTLTAQEVAAEESLDQIMVTASRMATPLSQTSKQVTIIGKEEIANAPVQSIQDLLLYVASIDVVQRGGHGVQADISMRGGTADQSAVLLNGVNLSSAHTGHYSMDLPVNLSDIERIEIIHGPAALIYGASAFSGGINIITKKSADYKAYLSMESGMHRLQGVEARGSLRTGIATNTLSASYNSSAGYTANSDYDLRNFLWQTRLNVSPTGMVDVSLGYNDKRYGANTFYSAAYPNQYEHTRNYVASVKGEFGNRLKLVPVIYWSRHHDRFELVRGTDKGRNFHRSDTYGANLAASLRWLAGTTTLGAEVRHEAIISSVLGKPMAHPHGEYKKEDDRTGASVTLEHSVNLEKMVVSAGVLMYYNTLQTGTVNFYPSASVTWRPTETFKAAASWSRSVRLPTFTDLYYTTETHNGNTGLKPERSESADLNLTYSQHLWNVHLTGFLLWGRNMIDWVKETPTASKWASWNLTKINTQGVEAGVSFRVGEVVPCLGKEAVLAVDYTRTHQTGNTGQYLSLYSLNYLRDKLTARFRHHIYKGLSAGWYFRLQKRMGRYEKYENLQKAGEVAYPGFTTLDVKFDYRYKDLNLSLNLNNLYNTKYFDLGNIPQAGFWLTGGISYTFR
jgi:iron complex outermembrane receptor protein